MTLPAELLKGGLMEGEGASPESEDEEESHWGLASLPIRRQARALALQLLFEVDASGHPLEVALKWALSQLSIPPEAVALAQELMLGVLQHQQSLDEQIRRFAPAWPVSQLAIVDRNLLRLAIYEVTMKPYTPPKAAINEAVELAKLFGSESSPRFVNGVLGALMESMVQRSQL